MPNQPISTSAIPAEGKTDGDGGRGIQSQSAATRLQPVRGLIPLHNRHGHPYKILDLKRWLRICRLVHKVSKIDLLVYEPRQFRLVELLFEAAKSLDVRLSLRTDAMAPPPDLNALKEKGLLDVFLTPTQLQSQTFRAWLDAATEAGLPPRLQLTGAFPPDLDPAALVNQFVAARVPSVNISVFDLFLGTAVAQDADETRRTLDQIVALVRGLEAQGVETALIGLPFCQVPKDLWAQVLNSRQFYLDHQQYKWAPYDLAIRLFRRPPLLAGLVILSLLTRYTLHRTVLDDTLLPWILDKPWINIRVALARRLTRHLRVLRSAPKPIESTEEAYRAEIARLAAEESQRLGPVCGECSLRRICDCLPPRLSQTLPGLALEAQSGDLVASPLHFATRPQRYYDAVDTARLAVRDDSATLAKHATEYVVNHAPTRVLHSADYGVEGSFYDPMEGGVRWFSLSNCEKLSTPLGRYEPPFTLALTFAGGMADFIGFSLGREMRVVCPMELYKHELTLHVGPNGHYVLLRDGALVRPMEFEGGFHVPLLLHGMLEPRISIFNIDGSMVTQAVRVWEGEREIPGDPAEIQFSVVIVCTRYARRLQATLCNLAHQEGVDQKQIEVVVAYVPGLDATDDVLDSLQAAFPQLRILRAPYPPDRVSSKGFLINESTKMASGEWIVLLDADILLPSNMFAVIEKEGKDAHFLFPDGRKMLSRETTAKILLGEIEPWRQWQELLDGPGEHRRTEAKGIPIGYCQCVRATCMKEVPYREVEHFEWADMQFGVDMREKYGMEKRLDVPVLHLDHGGSRWYGTQQHF